jgi:hypothetical protein
MSEHNRITPEEAADRLSIRELVDAYAHYADHRDAPSQMSLFTPDIKFLVYMDAKNPEPSQKVTSRDGLAPVFEELKKYEATMHFVGQSTIFGVGSGQAKGETYCLAHHITLKDGKRSLMIAALRYLDAFVKQDGRWLFAERRLYVVWIEERPLS